MATSHYNKSNLNFARLFKFERNFHFLISLSEMVIFLSLILTAEAVTEVFHKKICSYNVHKIYRKTPVLESLFIKNGTVAKMFSFELYQIFKNIFLQNNSWRLHFLLEFTARKLYKYGVMKTTINIVDIFF